MNDLGRCEFFRLLKVWEFLNFIFGGKIIFKENLESCWEGGSEIWGYFVGEIFWSI